MPQEFGLDTRQRILAAAANVFAKNGFRAATVASIAQSAGLNAITVYRYFPKKQEMYWAALDQKLRSSGFVDQVIQVMRSQYAPQEFVNRVAVEAIQSLVREPSLARLLYFTVLELESEKKMLFRAYLKPLMQLLTNRIESWVKSGETRNVKPEAVAIVIVGVIFSCCNLHDMFGFTPAHPFSAQELADECADICAGGIVPARLGEFVELKK
jgi:AcrR family transcriptional regulator